MEETAQTPPAAPQTIVDRWIEALRSGRYKQANGWLRTVDGYCCMGVCVEAGGCEWTTKSDDVPTYAMASYGDRQRVPESLLLQWGIHPQWQTIFINANDWRPTGATFEEIAKFAEEHKAELSIYPPLPWKWRGTGFEIVRED